MMSFSIQAIIHSIYVTQFLKITLTEVKHAPRESSNEYLICVYTIVCSAVKRGQFYEYIKPLMLIIKFNINYRFLKEDNPLL